MIYDLVVIGGGPAGITSSMYAARAKLKTLVIEKENLGGQIKITNEMVNYPGIQKITGEEYMKNLRNQSINFGVEFKVGEVVDLELDGDIKTIKTKDENIQTRAIIIATGASAKKLGFKGEEEFAGRGVAYCATCDGEFFQDLDVFVIGGGFAAAEESLYLTKYAKKVRIVVRQEEFSCAQSIIEQVKSNDKIEVWYNTELQELKGQDFIESAVFINNKTKEVINFKSEENMAFGVFVFIGYKPQTDIFKDKIDMDDKGYILTDENLQTNKEGVYAVGDLRPKPLRQVVTAVADGAIGAVSAEKYIQHQKHRLGIKHEPLENKIKKEEIKKEEVNVDLNDKKRRSKLLNDDMRNQIKSVLALMENEVNIVSIVDKTNNKSIELMDLLLDIESLGEKLNVEIYEKSQNEEMEKLINADKYPIAALLDKNKNYSGVKFQAVPGGHELNSFILAIYNLAGPGQALDKNVLDEIKSINKKINMKVMVSLSCTLCPEVVVASHKIAIENDNIEAEMIDISLFEELKKKYKIMSVPAIVINDTDIYFGAKKISQIVELLKK